MKPQLDLRVLKAYDGFRYSFEMLDYVATGLYDACCKTAVDPSMAAKVLWRCWSIVDVCFRVRELAQAVPGLGRRNVELKDFLQETVVVPQCRHYVQHLRSELSKSPPNPYPVWGALSWIDPADRSLCHTLINGVKLAGDQYASVVFDSAKRTWVSRVSLDVNGVALHIDPVVASCRTFEEFVIPWITARYSDLIRQIEPDRVVSARMSIP